jgi:hypothetical protein
VFQRLLAIPALGNPALASCVAGTLLVPAALYAQTTSSTTQTVALTEQISPGGSSASPESQTAQSASPVAQTASSAAQGTPPPRAAPAPASRPPVFNRANDHLPDWLRVRAEFRERVEGGQNVGFTEGRDDFYALTRFRFNVAATPNPNLGFQLGLHDSRVADKELGVTTPCCHNPFDVRTAFADVGSAKAPIAVRAGRQELAYGEQRLLGHLAWVNTGRSWDGARVSLRSKPAQVDVFAASVVRSLAVAWTSAAEDAGVCWARAGGAMRVTVNSRAHRRIRIRRHLAGRSRRSEPPSLRIARLGPRSASIFGQVRGARPERRMRQKERKGFRPTATPQAERESRHASSSARRSTRARRGHR